MQQNLLLLADYNYRSLSVSWEFKKDIKYNFPDHKRKHNVSINPWHELNTKKLEYVMVDLKNRGMIQNPVRMVKKTVRLSIFELNDSILLSLVKYSVGSLFKILRVSWYK